MSEEGRYEPFMRAVTTTDNGGPHDPASYGCGWEMGRLYAVLGTMRHLGILTHVTQIHTVNVPQADLYAMHFHLDAKFETYDEVPDWTEATFTLQAIDAEPEVGL